MGRSAEERTAARDFTMARLAAARGAIAHAAQALDDVLLAFVDPEEDKRGEERSLLLESIDGHLGVAATAVQLAMSEWEDVDPQEGEPEGDEDEEEEEEEDDEDEEDEREPRRRAR